MSRLKLFQEILAQYQRHGWRLARVLARPETLAEMRGADDEGHGFAGAALAESEVDAMWFTRPSSEGREAWELRLAGGTPYALFELFEPDEAEEEREDVRREMEARLRDYAGGSQK
jgi:Xaa-Pro aminopeptidase